MCGPKMPSGGGSSRANTVDPDSRAPDDGDVRLARERDKQRRRAAGYGNLIFTSPTGAGGSLSGTGVKPKLLGG